MRMSLRLQGIGLVLSGLVLAGGSTAAEAAGAIQMARDATVRGDLSPSRGGRRAATVPPRIYLLRGLANVFSQGLDDLAAKLRARGYNASVHSHGEWETIAEQILVDQRASGGRHRAVVVGHSLGANAVTDIANAVGMRGSSVALAVAFDPTLRRQLSGGAQRYVNIYQSNNGWGAPITAASGYRGRLQNVDLSQARNISHFNIEKDPTLHAHVMALIAQAVGTPRLAVPQAAAR